MPAEYPQVGDVLTNGPIDALVTAVYRSDTETRYVLSVDPPWLEEVPSRPWPPEGWTVLDKWVKVKADLLTALSVAFPPEARVEVTGTDGKYTVTIHWRGFDCMPEGDRLIHVLSKIPLHLCVYVTDVRTVVPGA